jgi:hypothetical protein
VPLIRVVYHSKKCITATGPALWAQYNDIVSTARRNNARKAISGFLFLGSESFVQILEGDETHVADLLAQIERDKRHTAMKVVLKTVIDQPLFGEWSMGAVLKKMEHYPVLKARGHSGLLQGEQLPPGESIAIALELVGKGYGIGPVMEAPETA